MLINTLSVYSQNGPPNEGQLAIEQFRSGSVLVNAFYNRYEGIKGTPFLADGWLPGVIYLDQEGGQLSDISLHLDIFNQDLYVMPPAGHSFFKLELQISSFDLFSNADTLGFIRIPADRIRQSMHPAYYLQIIWTGENLALYKMPFKIMRKADFKGAYANGERYDEFLVDEFWYLYYDQSYHKIKLTNKALIKLFPHFKSELAEDRIEDLKDFLECLKRLDAFLD